MGLKITSVFKNGVVGCLSCEWYNTEFDIFMEEYDSNMMIISTFSGLAVPGVHK